MRHWHTREDEFVYMLEGELVLRTDGGEQLLRAGMCAGFAGRLRGRTSAHQSQQPAGDLPRGQQPRPARTRAHYADPDVDLVWSPAHARRR